MTSKVKGNPVRKRAKKASPVDLHQKRNKININKIKTASQHRQVMDEILVLMNKGEGNLTKIQSAKLRALAHAAQSYEKAAYNIPPPSTIEGMIELKMFERRLRQKDLAKLMELSESKLSQIMTGKRAPDIAFLKAAYHKLGIDASFLLEHA